MSGSDLTIDRTMSTLNIILAGVGGQGILSAAYLIDHAAVSKGYHFKQAETHGMAQRGGTVCSHVRISTDEIISDLIPEGEAHIIIGLEPLEVQRYLQFLHPDGIVIANTQPVINIPDYPAKEVIMDALLRLPRAVIVDAGEIAGQAKAPRAQNVAILGAAIPFLPFKLGDFLPFVEELFSAKGKQLVQKNIAVLTQGHKVGAFHKILLESDITTPVAYGIVNKLDISTIDPGLAGEESSLYKKDT